MTDTPFLTHAALQTRHGFFTREGGVSTGLYASLNCGYGSKDDNEKVSENLRRVATAMHVEPPNLLSCRQIHSNRVVTVTKPWPREERPEADGMVTREKNIALGALSADCAPVLFHDVQAGVIGAAHAGWKGALGGVLEETVSAMEKLGAKLANITAVVGACIQQNSYEVGPEFPAPFLKQDAANESFFKKAPREGHFLFDLPGYAQRRLKLRGLMNVHSLGFDTCSDETRFFSYRRATKRKEAGNGTLISAIVLK
ncbi:MAG TPA: peptidoglycan editing factor PgeF [Alphaproteobacteria bacterium]|nr:peptidoglycan editing factor PgeF [Alphaproteobacteria bacterium]